MLKYWLISLVCLIPSGGHTTEWAGGLGTWIAESSSPGAQRQQWGDACCQQFPHLCPEPGPGRSGAASPYPPHVGFHCSQPQLAIWPWVLQADHVPARFGVVCLSFPSLCCGSGAMPMSTEACVGSTTTALLGCSSGLWYLMAGGHHPVCPLLPQHCPD